MRSSKVTRISILFLLFALVAPAAFAARIPVTDSNRGHFSAVDPRFRYSCYRPTFTRSRNIFGRINHRTITSSTVFSEIKSADVTKRLALLKAQSSLLKRQVSRLKKITRKGKLYLKTRSTLDKKLAKIKDEIVAIKATKKICALSRLEELPSPTPTVTPTESESPTPSPTVSPSPTPSFTPTPTITPDQTGRPYPRLTGPLVWVEQWPEDMLYQFDEIEAYNIVESINIVKQRARDHGHSDWADRVKFTVNYGLQTADFTSPATQWPPTKPSDWAYQTASHNPDWAISIAIYENAIRGADWLLHDSNGDLITIWTGQYATNWSSACPKGVWDGRYTVNGVTYDLGDTRGKNIVEWMVGPMKQAVMLNPEVTSAVDGITLEDGPFVGIPCWMYPSIMLDPERNGNFMSCAEYADFSFPTYQQFMVDFVQDLKDTFIFRSNLHGINLSGTYTPAIQLIFDSFRAPKFESYGNWGGWPTTDNAQWFRLWDSVEQKYDLFGDSSFNDPLDKEVGQEMAVANIMPRRNWSSDAIRQWLRHRLGHVLMHDGSAAFSWQDDQFGHGYILGDYDSWPDIPEMHFALGYPLGPKVSYTPPGTLGTPLYYRRFQKDGQNYTVAVNIWNTNIADIPANDSVWFRGDWPSGQYNKIEF